MGRVVSAQRRCFSSGRCVVTPGEIAELDQDLAGVHAHLDNMIALYRSMAGEPVHEALGDLAAAFLAEDLDAEELAMYLAIAVSRLSAAGETLPVLGGGS